MTRLTDDDVMGVSDSLESVNDMLKRCTGRTMLELACDAANITTDYLNPEDFTVGVVPITSGMGVITRFSESVADVCRSLGMESFVTETYDVTGIAEALARMPDLLFMADDYQFVAYNTRARRSADNSSCTAAGYVAALVGAAGGVAGKEVLVLGTGRVGSRAASLLQAKGAKITLADIDRPKAEAVSKNLPGSNVADNIVEATASHNLIINASPAHVDSRNIQKGAIISSPGVPHTFDEEAYAKATIIHDPLSIGVSVMAMQSAAFIVPGEKKCRR